jgi:Holliday junction DNA helicase RuvA
MIYFVRGELAEVFEDWIAVDCQGIGYQIRVPASLIGDLPPVGCEVKIYTYMAVREDAVTLYGFLSRDELDIFRMLITVNGIGPKVGLGILSAIRPDDLRFAVLSDDVKAISEAPGVGKKTAQKLILELKDKMKLEDAFEARLARNGQGDAAGLAGTADVRGEAAQALTALGYSASEAMKAVRAVEAPEGAQVEDILKLALKKLSFM